MNINNNLSHLIWGRREWSLKPSTWSGDNRFVEHFKLITEDVCVITCRFCRGNLQLTPGDFPRCCNYFFIHRWPLPNRLKIALRNAANAIGNLNDTHLSNFFKRVQYRRGRFAAVSSTSRKLGVILWTMIVKKVPYQPPTQYLFLDEKRKLKIVKQIRKTIAKFDISTTDLQIVTTWF